MKSRIVEQLGQAELMLPNLVAGALKANERAKLRMSILQAAVQHAHDPHSPPPDLAAECGSAGIDAVAKVWQFDFDRHGVSCFVFCISWLARLKTPNTKYQVPVTR